MIKMEKWIKYHLQENDSFMIQLRVAVFSTALFTYQIANYQ